jgi:hypothetical protein
MSSALASARKRSMAPPPPSPLRQGSVPSNQTPPVSNPGSVNTTATNAQLTLPQIIDIYGRRLLHIEKQMESGVLSNNNNVTLTAPKIDEEDLTKRVDSSVQSQLNTFVEKEWIPLVDEWNARHELLVQEITSLKDLLLNLQNFTLGTHKKLLDIALEPFTNTESESEQMLDTDENILNSSSENVLASSEIILGNSGQNILDDEPEESHESIQQYLEQALKSIPEEYELNNDAVNL